MAVWILGTGGHARAVNTIRPGKMTDENPTLHKNDYVIIGVGDIETRRRLWAMYAGRIHRVIGSDYAGTAEAVQVMRQAYVCPTSSLGINVLVNTGAQVDHDCTIGDHSVISPGAVLCGGVILGEACYISAGAVVLQEVHLPDETYIPPGAVVYGPHDIRVPARTIPHLGTV